MTELYYNALHVWWLTSLQLVTTLSSLIVRHDRSGCGLYDDVYLKPEEDGDD